MAKYVNSPSTAHLLALTVLLVVSIGAAIVHAGKSNAQITVKEPISRGA